VNKDAISFGCNSVVVDVGVGVGVGDTSADQGLDRELVGVGVGVCRWNAKNKVAEAREGCSKSQALMKIENVTEINTPVGLPWDTRDSYWSK
jgi:hypothetical protein